MSSFLAGGISFKKGMIKKQSPRMGFMVLTAKEFIEKKEEEFERSRKEQKVVTLTDIGGGKQKYLREKWVFMIQSDDPNRVLVLEKLRKLPLEGKKCPDFEEGCIRYRIGYFVVGKMADFPIKITHEGGKFVWEGYTRIIFKKDTMTWEGYCPIMPRKDLKRLMKEAAKKGVISRDILSAGIF